MDSKKVVAAMSGGVDSSVTAALLKERGFEVVGVTMEIWQHSRGYGGYFDGGSSTGDVKEAADILGIPHLALDFRDIFREKVIANFCEEYREGRTPNPCIRCNQYIKFGALIEKARELGADYIATGHYARIEKREDRYFLKKGVDTEKDQSYVLYTMTQEQLKHTLMPLGDFTKEEVRKIAKKKGLPAADRQESQEICFIKDGTYGEFLKRYIPEGVQPGPIVSKEGKVIGEHRGIIFYTIGQRKGIGVPVKKPLYVIAIDRAKNKIVVGDENDVYGDELIADNVNYIAAGQLKGPVRVNAKIRYLHQASSALVSPLSKDKIKVKFDSPQRAITPGQAVVFYDGDIVLGGGTIFAITNSSEKKK